jgi:phosphopantetheinyl transferase (holo-ACP synthase)
VVLRGRAAQAANGGRVHLSISHSRDYAIAVAVLESE